MPVYSVASPSEDQLAAREQLALNAGCTKQRKRNTRRKIVAGAAMIAAASDDAAVRRVLRAVLQARVTRPIDLAVVADLLDG